MNKKQMNERYEESVRGNKPTLSFLSLDLITVDPSNARKHSRAQVRAIAKSIEAFGFNAPILIDRNRQIIAGHGRYEAAKLLGLAQVPILFLDHLTETQARAYQLADNKLTDRSSYDDVKVAVQLKELSELVLDFDIEAVGFELPEIDLRILSLDTSDAADKADDKRALLPFFRLAALFAAQFKFQRVKRGVVWSALTFFRSALLSRPRRLNLTSRSRSQRAKRRRWSAMDRQALRRT